MLKNRNPVLKGLIEWVAILGLALLLALVARNYLFRITMVSGYSMEPTLTHGDILVLNRFTYLFNDPGVGDIVAFPDPQNPSDFLIKRVIAVSGDLVEIQNQTILVNGEALVAPAFDEPLFGSALNLPMVVAEGHLFVLGDNRNHSRDSRCVSVGALPKEAMLGRANLRFWPLSAFGRVN